MVHRPSDSRLLSNLISHEKDYSKQLLSLLDYSHSSLASFSAFAAASPPPISQLILSVASNLLGANDALGRYKDAVDAWREQLKALKDMEEEVSNIIRDREILVTRLLKASKNEKPPKDRERTNTPSRRLSVLTQNQTPGSSSSLSLSLDHSTTYNPNSSLPTSTKLAAAQAELQACEVHLANKEHQLELGRVNAIRDGLRIRCHALIECGSAWGEMGKVALRTVESLRYDQGGPRGPKHEPYLASPAPPSFKHLPLHIRAEIESATEHRESSEFSSISPSQSASQVNMRVDETGTAPPPVIPNAPGPILGINGSDIQNSSQRIFVDAETNESPTPQGYRALTPIASPYSPPPPIGLFNYPYSAYAIPLPRSSASLTNVLATAGGTYEYDYNKIQVPPAHAITELTLPTVVTKPTTVPGTASGYLTPVSNEEGGSHSKPYSKPTGTNQNGGERQRLSRLILQETKPEDVDLEGNVGGPDLGKQDGLGEDGLGVEESKLRTVDSHQHQTNDDVEQTIDNAAIMPRLSLNEGESAHHFPVVRERRDVEGLPVERDTVLPPDMPSSTTRGSLRQTPKKSGFLGSLKGLFTGHHRDSGSAGRERDRTGEKEEKRGARQKEGKREEKAKDREEKAREREQGTLRGRERKASAKQETREQERQKRVLVPSTDSSDDGMLSEEDVFTSRKRQGSGADRGGGLLSWGRRSSDAWTTRTDKNLSQIRRETAGVGDKVEGVVDGYVMKRNMGLQKNLKGIITGHHPSPSDPRTGRGIYGDAGARVGGSNASLGTANGSPTRPSSGGSRLKKPRRISLQNGSRPSGSRGRREGRSASVPPEPVTSSASGLTPEGKATLAARNIPTRTNAPSSVSHLSPGTAPTRITPALFAPQPDKQRDGAYMSDTTGLASSSRALVPTNINGAPTSGPTGEPSTKRRKSAARGTETDIIRLGRETSVLSGPVAPAGMSTGLGGGGHIGRRGSVGVSVATPGPPLSISHRRSSSLSYGRSDLTSSKKATIPFSGSSPSLPYQPPQESLMSIVDSVTKSNRQAWGDGMTGSRMDKTKAGGASSIHGVDRASISSQSGMKLDGAAKSRDGMGDVVRAPPRIERQALLASLKGDSESSGGGQPVTTTTKPVVKSPLKSALRPSRSPSPTGARAHAHKPALVNGNRTRKFHAQAPDSSEDKMDRLTSLSSLPVEEHKANRAPARQVVEVRDAVRNGEGDDDDDSASTSSYETGHENFESGGEEKRRGNANVPATSTWVPVAQGQSTAERRPATRLTALATSTPVRQDHTSHSGVPAQQHQDDSPISKSTTLTPQRRKSVRVSLQPTFSPTPPAIEDEESEDGRAPFVWKETAPATVKERQIDRSSSPLQAPKTYTTQKGREKHDVWQDSDDDLEYQTAKKLLQKTRR